MEFYLFRRDEDGQPTRIPYDDAGYMDIAPADKGENVRREVCLTLERMGIRPESSHHEEGPGQNEIDFRYADPLTAADNAVTFRTVVDTVAARNGLYADFGPKPLENQPGNGMHINFSVVGEKRQDVMPAAIAGVMAHCGEMTAFLNPTDASQPLLAAIKPPVYLLVCGEPLPADPGSGGGRGVPPGGASLSRSALQPLSGVYPADPGGAWRALPEICSCPLRRI